MESSLVTLTLVVLSSSGVYSNGMVTAHAWSTVTEYQVSKWLLAVWMKCTVRRSQLCDAATGRACSCKTSVEDYVLCKNDYDESSVTAILSLLATRVR